MGRPIVYGTAGSTYVWSVRLALAEKGVAHELVEVGFGPHREEPHLSRHPFAKIPAFEHDGFQLYETQAILRYIDEGFPVAPLVNRVLKPRMGLPADEAAISAALPRAQLCVSEISRLMGEQPYLTGDRVTLADLMVIPLFYFFGRVPEGEAPLSEYPNIRPWMRRMEERQSFQVTKPPPV
jgi:glutathione S-transferase